jgi:hypothetical protein
MHRFIMKILILVAVSILISLLAFAADSSAGKDSRCYEMRTYHTPPGKLQELHARFRNHTLKLFEKHGMINIGYWVPMDKEKGADNTLIYILAYPSREAREKSWKAFMADPDWQTAMKASEVNGKLVEKADSVFLTATDYSPMPSLASTRESRCFELRTYTAAPGKLAALNARFRDHTMELFKKHGMTNIGYFVPMDEAQGAQNTLIYILAHKNKEAAAASFKAFGADPDWVKAKKESEEKAGGPLTVQDGVKSVFMMPTDYSPMK